MKTKTSEERKFAFIPRQLFAASQLIRHYGKGPFMPNPFESILKKAEDLIRENEQVLEESRFLVHNLGGIMFLIALECTGVYSVTVSACLEMLPELVELPTDNTQAGTEYGMAWKVMG